MTTTPPPADNQDLQRQLRATWATALGIIVGLAIIFVAVDVLIPWFRGAMRNARLNDCHGYTKQISLAILNYADVHGHFPPAYTTDAAGNRLHSWRTLLLPYIEQQELFDSIDFSKPWNDPVNAVAFNAKDVFPQCPALPKEVASAGNLTTYLAIVTPNSVIRAGTPTPSADLEASSSTVMFVDAPPDKAVHWMSPYDADETLLLELGLNSKPRSQHPGDIMMSGFADGHSQLLTPNLDEAARRALITVLDDDNDAIPDP